MVLHYIYFFHSLRKCNFFSSNDYIIIRFAPIRGTVTRPYAGFRHQDRMAPDSSVWGGENDCFYMVREYARSGTEVFRHFSEIRNFPGIYMAICQGSPLPMLVLYIPRCRKIFPEFYGDFPVKKWKSVRHLGSNSCPEGYLPSPLPLDHNYLIWSGSKHDVLFFIHSSEFAIKNKR
jgi:hypothetical protein